MGDLSDFERGKIVGSHLAGASATKNATLLGVPKATVSQGMSAAYSSEEKQWAKNNTDKKKIVVH
jgi:hypothetical protein